MVQDCMEMRAEMDQGRLTLGVPSEPVYPPYFQHMLDNQGRMPLSNKASRTGQLLSIIEKQGTMPIGGLSRVTRHAMALSHTATPVIGTTSRYWKLKLVHERTATPPIGTTSRYWKLKLVRDRTGHPPIGHISRITQLMLLRKHASPIVIGKP